MDPWVDQDRSRQRPADRREASVAAAIQGRIFHKRREERARNVQSPGWTPRSDRTGVPGPHEEDMSKRGMLPKFRPATLGLTATHARPSIRPVKPIPPGPAPSPPRRRESGFGPRSTTGHEDQAGDQAGIETERYDLDMPTAGGVGEPSTLNRGPVTLPRDNAPETVQASPRGGRGNVMQLQFDDETQARPVDDHVAGRQAKADLGVEYESLPSLEVRPPYDTFEAAFQERDPVTQARESAHVRRADPREGSYNREPSSYQQQASFKEASYNRAPPSYQEPSYKEPSYKEPSYQEPSHPAPIESHEQEFWGRREGSGPRSRPIPPAPQSYEAPAPSYAESRPWGEPPPAPAPAPMMAYAPTGFSSMPPSSAQYGYEQQQQHIPPAPRLPEEMRGQPGFVMGVQPVRNATPPDAWVAAQPHQHPPIQVYLPSPMQAMGMHGMPAGYGVAANHQVYPQMPQMVQASPRVMSPTPYPQQPQQYYQPQHPQQGYPVQQRHPTPTPGSGQAISASVNRAQPVGGQLTTPPASTMSSPMTVGRFAWFVAGAAFGIAFAFFATGFFNGAKAARDEFPPAAALPAATQMAAAPVAPVAPAVVTAPAPVPQPPVVGVPTTPSSLPNATAQVRPASVAGATAVAPRFNPPRTQRPAPRRAPRSNDDGAVEPKAEPKPEPKSSGSNPGDLLGAGLNP
jgi:hypothetical protein